MFFTKQTISELEHSLKETQNNIFDSIEDSGAFTSDDNLLIEDVLKINFEQIYLLGYFSALQEIKEEKENLL